MTTQLNGLKNLLIWTIYKRVNSIGYGSSKTQHQSKEKMKLDRVILFLWIPILFAVETLAGSSIPQKFDRKSLKASQFPPDFLFGAAVAAYQVKR